MRVVLASVVPAALAACGPGRAVEDLAGVEDPTAVRSLAERDAERAEGAGAWSVCRSRPPEGAGWDFEEGESLLYGETRPLPEGVREYDLSAVPAAGQDAGDAFPDHVYPEDFRTRITRAVYAETSPSSWPKATTFLGWRSWWDREDSLRLVVLQDAAGYAAVERALDRCATTGGDAIRVSVARLPDVAATARGLGVVPPAKGGAVLLGTAPPRLSDRDALAVDAPWGRRARSFEGTASEVVADYDVTISMGTYLEPYVLWVESGLAVCAERTRGPDGFGIDVEVAWTTRAPPYPMRRVQSFCREVELACLPPAEARFRGVLPAVPGLRALASLDGECGAWIEVGAETGPGRLPQRSWWIVGSGPSVRPTVRGLAVEEPCGGGSASSAVLARTGAVDFDVSWSLTGPVQEWRDETVLDCTVECHLAEEKLLRLRTARRVVCSRRVLVPSGAGASLRVWGDVGRGSEELSLTLLRAP